MDILFADDHAVVREGLIPFLEKLDDGIQVLEAADYEGALAEARRSTDLRLLVLDLYMPGMNGPTGIATFRAQFPRVPLAVLSGSTETNDALRALQMGAAAYIPKTMRGSAIQRVLRLVMDGETYIPPFILQTVRSGNPISAIMQASRLAPLSPRELDILRGLVDGAPNKQIARDLGLQEVTIKAHLRNIFRKLSVKNRTEAAMIGGSEGLSGRHSSSYPQSCG